MPDVLLANRHGKSEQIGVGGDLEEWLVKHPHFVMHFTPTSAS